MSFSVEPPPDSLSEEAKEYIQRVLIQVAASFEELEVINIELEKRIKTLESKP